MPPALHIRASATHSAFAHRGATVAATRMLMEEALERLEAARELDLGGTGPAAAGGLKDSAVALLGVLRAGLDLHCGGAFAANVDDLYEYMCRRLTAADPGNGFAALHEVSHLLDALHSAWPYMPEEVRTARRN